MERTVRPVAGSVRSIPVLPGFPLLQGKNLRRLPKNLHHLSHFFSNQCFTQLADIGLRALYQGSAGRTGHRDRGASAARALTPNQAGQQRCQC